MDSLNLRQELDDAAQPESVTILIFSERERMFTVLHGWDCSGGADQAIGGQSCEAELHQLLFTSLFYWCFLQGFAYSLLPREALPATSNDTSRSPAHAVVLSLCWGSRGFHMINTSPVGAAELWHKQCEQPETHQAPIGRPIRFIPMLNLQPVLQLCIWQLGCRMCVAFLGCFSCCAGNHLFCFNWMWNITTVAWWIPLMAQCTVSISLGWAVCPLHCN